MVPAQTFPPSEFLKDEMEARRWEKEELAEAVGCQVDGLLAGTEQITQEVARKLGEAFGTGPEVWVNLEAAYRRQR